MDEEQLRELYKQLASDRRAADVREWETVKFYTTVYSALISITVGIAVAIVQNHEFEFTAPLRIIVVALPLVACSIVILGLLNLWREDKYLFSLIAMMRKIEGYFGLLDEVPEEKRVFKKDKLLHPQMFWKEEYKNFTSQNQYVKARTKFGLEFFWISACLFLIFIIVGLILAILLAFYF